MRILANRSIQALFMRIVIAMSIFIIALELALIRQYGKASLEAIVLSLCLAAVVFLCIYIYFQKQDELLEDAVTKTTKILSGDKDCRIACSQEGELYRLFQSVNALSAVLCAHAEREQQRNEFLKSTISDISHQLKTPLAALNIYNGLLAEADNPEDVQHFVQASEGELDRMGTLVKDLLKLTRLDTGAIELEKHPENLADVMAELKQRFLCRAQLEKKEIVLEGEDEIFCCDVGWLSEALGNLLKNALDHTKEGESVKISWKRHGDIQNIVVQDNGCGIHPDDIHHIFKRFYRSRFSKDKQGIGLGLPLAKAIILAHDGTIEVESELGKGTVFSIRFLTKL